jgi:hypothetical protein
MSLLDARLDATEETEERAIILAVETEIRGVSIPVGFAMNGRFYFADGDDCPLCDGSGLVMTGWDDEVYENIEDSCPCCDGTGVATGKMTIEFAQHQADHVETK